MSARSGWSRRRRRSRPGRRRRCPDRGVGEIDLRAPAARTPWPAYLVERRSTRPLRTAPGSRTSPRRWCSRTSCAPTWPRTGRCPPTPNWRGRSRCSLAPSKMWSGNEHACTTSSGRCYASTTPAYLPPSPKSATAYHARKPVQSWPRHPPPLRERRSPSPSCARCSNAPVASAASTPKLSGSRPRSTASSCASSPSSSRPSAAKPSPCCYATSTPRIFALVVQPDQEVLPGQLRRRHPDQQLPTGMAPVAGLDRPDRCIQRPDHAESVNQLGHRRHPRHARQRRVRRADPHPPPQPADITYSAHQMGVLPTSMIVATKPPSSQVSRAPIPISPTVSRRYSRIRVRESATLRRARRLGGPRRSLTGRGGGWAGAVPVPVLMWRCCLPIVAVPLPG